MAAIICRPSVYQFEGWLFEVHSYCGPWPLTKSGTPRKRAGKKFYQMYERFSKLSFEQQNCLKTVEGGCFKI